MEFSRLEVQPNVHAKEWEKKKSNARNIMIVFKKIAHENKTHGNVKLLWWFSQFDTTETYFSIDSLEKTMLKQRTGMFTLKLIPARRSNAVEKLFQLPEQQQQQQ